jgi:hypothetical protein
MDKEEIKIKEFDKEQLELLLKDLQDIDKFTGFKDGAFKYELGKYQANLLVNCIKKQKEVIDRILNETKETRDILNNNRDDNMLSKCCLLSYLEIVEDLLKEVSE